MFFKSKQETKQHVCNYVCIDYFSADTSALTDAERSMIIQHTDEIPQYVIVLILQCSDCGSTVVARDFGFGISYKYELASNLNPPLLPILKRGKP